MFDPKYWRALARGPEYVAPHTTVLEGRPLATPTSTQPPALLGSPKTARIALPPSSSRAFAAASSIGSSGAAHFKRTATNQSPRRPAAAAQGPPGQALAPVPTPRPPRSTRTLTKLIEEIEEYQRRDIHARVSGHLNHDKVFAPLRTLTIRKSAHTWLEEDPVAAAEAGAELDGGRPASPVAPERASSPAARPQTPPGSGDPSPPQPSSSPTRKRRIGMVRDAAAAGGARASSPDPPPITTTVPLRQRNPDRANVLYHQFEEELKVQASQPLGRVQVASRYFDLLIQDFRMFAPLLSGIKTVYQEVVDQYLTDVRELDHLKRQLIKSIAEHQAKASRHDDLEDECRDLTAERDTLAAHVHALELQLQQMEASNAAASDEEQRDQALGLMVPGGTGYDVGGSVMPSMANSMYQLAESSSSTSGEAAREAVTSPDVPESSSPQPAQPGA
ncbi:hypothetical protein H9P43_001131 [Blastocladiella emersonii ATCC 22665]|nr:hypothetical protein H9P43_001131 [Blastocladiella emersonii ATCC 22665]